VHRKKGDYLVEHPIGYQKNVGSGQGIVQAIGSRYDISLLFRCFLEEPYHLSAPPFGIQQKDYRPTLCDLKILGQVERKGFGDRIFGNGPINLDRIHHNALFKDRLLGGGTDHHPKTKKDHQFFHIIFFIKNPAKIGRSNILGQL
jgi:hypothetical protein